MQNPMPSIEDSEKFSEMHSETDIQNSKRKTAKKPRRTSFFRIRTMKRYRYSKNSWKKRNTKNIERFKKRSVETTRGISSAPLK